MAKRLVLTHGFWPEYSLSFWVIRKALLTATLFFGFLAKIPLLLASKGFAKNMQTVSFFIISKIKSPAILANAAIKSL